MTLTELTALFRSHADDKAVPYLWSDEEVRLFLNEAEREAAIRSHLLQDSWTLTTSANQDSYSAVTQGQVTIPFVKVLEVATASIGNDAILRSYGAISMTAGKPQYFWTSSYGTINISPKPDKAYTIDLWLTRLPIKDMVAANDSPEIPQQYHLALVYWALKLAYEMRDVDTGDGTMSASYEAKFTQHFGYRHTANVQRKHKALLPPILKTEMRW